MKCYVIFSTDLTQQSVVSPNRDSLHLTLTHLSCFLFIMIFTAFSQYECVKTNSELINYKSLQDNAAEIMHKQTVFWMHRENSLKHLTCEEYALCRACAVLHCEVQMSYLHRLVVYPIFYESCCKFCYFATFSSCLWTMQLLFFPSYFLGRDQRS